MTAPATKEYITKMQCIWESVQQRLIQQQTNNAQWVDQARREAGIAVGDDAMLSTCNLKLKSHPGKLQPLYIGLVKVTQAVGCNEFKLDLLVMLRVHLVFNVLLLWWYIVLYITL